LRKIWGAVVGVSARARRGAGMEEAAAARLRDLRRERRWMSGEMGAPLFDESCGLEISERAEPWLSEQTADSLRE